MENAGNIGLKLGLRQEKHALHFNLARMNTGTRNQFNERKRTEMNLLRSGPGKGVSKDESFFKAV